jgi:3-methyladenine DNA glycosylase Tag
MKSFAAIRHRAAERKGGEEVLERLLGAAPDNARLAAVTDDRILSMMASRVFSAGFVWSVIEQKWPGFEAAFLGFEPKALLFQPEDFWHDLASDKRIVRNPQKIGSVRENAEFVERVSREHGGFGRFLAAWPAGDQIGLTGYLAKHGSRLGGNTGQYFLRFIGWDAFIVSGDMASAGGCRDRRESDVERRYGPHRGAGERLGRGDRPLPHAHLAHSGDVDRHQPHAGADTGIHRGVIVISSAIW